VRSNSIEVSFIEPMLCLSAQKIPEGSIWQYELTLDGYRAIGARTRFGVQLWSRNKKDFSWRFTYKDLAGLFDWTMSFDSSCDNFKYTRQIARKVGY
jgi:hypothetical protein